VACGILTYCVLVRISDLRAYREVREVLREIALRKAGPDVSR